MSSSYNTLTQNIANSNTGNGGDGAVGGLGGDGGDGYGRGIFLKYSRHITHAGNTACSNRGYGGSGADGLYADGEDGHGYSYNQSWNDASPPPQIGDLNGNDQITTANAAIALQLAARGAQNPAADMNDDGRITALDALMALQAASGAMKS